MRMQKRIERQSELGNDARNDYRLRRVKLGHKFERRILDNLIKNPWTQNVFQEKQLDEGRDCVVNNCSGAEDRHLRSDLARIQHLFCRLLIFNIGKICHVEFSNAGYVRRSNIHRRPLIVRLKSMLSKQTKLSELKWQDLFLCIFVYLICRVLYNLCYQYRLDAGLVKLDKFRRLTQEPESLELLAQTMNESLLTFENQTERNIKLARERLDEIGAPHMNWTVIVECLYLCIIQNGLCVYLSPVVFLKMLGGLDSDATGYLLGIQRQLRQDVRLIRAEVNSMIESSKSFTEARINRVLLLTGYSEEAEMEKHTGVRSLIEKHQFFVEQLERVAEKGRLQPLNRCIAAAVLKKPHYDRGLNELVSRFMYHFICGLLCCILTLAHLFSPLHKYYSIPEIKLDSWADYEFAAELGVMVLTLAAAVYLYVSLMLMITSDQNVAVGRLNKLVKQCILSNEIYLAKLLHGIRWQWEEIGAAREAPTPLGALRMAPDAARRASAARRSSSLLSSPLKGHRRSTLVEALELQISNLETLNKGEALEIILESEERRETLRECIMVSECRRAIRSCEHLDLGSESAPMMASGDVASDREGSSDSQPPKSMGRQARDEEIRLVKELEEDLILSLMHYRLFLAKFTKHKRLWGFFAANLLFLVTTWPLIIRLHVKYLDKSLKSHAFWISALSSSLLSIISPICHLRCRCLDSYKLLWGLLARLVAVEASGARQFFVPSSSLGTADLVRLVAQRHDKHGGVLLSLVEPRAEAATESKFGAEMRSAKSRINLEHAISMLRKELSNPDVFSHQFTPTAIGLNVNFNNLLKTLFWLWIVVMSILKESNTGKQGVFTHLLADPLGFNTFD